MRAVSFSLPQLQQKLNNEFICTWTSTEGDPTAGSSIRHPPQDTPGSCVRGNGQQNTQLLFLTPTGKIFHAISGYIDGDELLQEVEFAAELYEQLKSAEDGNQRETVVAAHQKRLADSGQTDSGNRPLAMFGSFPATPNMSGGFGNMQEGMSRMMESFGSHQNDHDTRFCIARPLVSYDEFDRNPTDLIGSGSTFFGSQTNSTVIINGVLMGPDGKPARDQSSIQPPQPDRKNKATERRRR